MKVRDYWPTWAYIGTMVLLIAIGAYHWPAGYGRLALGLAAAGTFATAAIAYANKAAVQSGRK